MNEGLKLEKKKVDLKKKYEAHKKKLAEKGLDLDNTKPQDLEKLTKLAARGLTKEEQAKLDDFTNGKLAEYEKLYQANKAQNAQAVARIFELEDELKKMEAARAEDALVIESITKKHAAMAEILCSDDKTKGLAEEIMNLETKLQAMIGLNRNLKEKVDEQAKTIALQGKYCDVCTILHKIKRGVDLSPEAATKLAIEYNDEYRKLYMGYKEDAEQCVEVTWRVNDKTITAAEGIDKIHKIFVKCEGISNPTEQQFKALVYEQMLKCDPEGKNFMEQKLKEMELELGKLKGTSPEMNKYYNDVVELQKAMYNPDNYPKNPDGTRKYEEPSMEVDLPESKIVTITPEAPVATLEKEKEEEIDYDIANLPEINTEEVIDRLEELTLGTH